MSSVLGLGSISLKEFVLTLDLLTLQLLGGSGSGSIIKNYFSGVTLNFKI